MPTTSSNSWSKIWKVALIILGVFVIGAAVRTFMHEPRAGGSAAADGGE